MKKSVLLKTPFIDLSRQQKSVQADVNAALRNIFSSQKFILGNYGRLLEEKIAEKTGAKFAVGVANGSDALYLALLALGIGPGDEVITTSFSFFATAGSITRTGAVPVFVDIDPQSFNLNPSKIRESLSKKTRAIMPVHLFGLPCAMGEIQKIADRYHLAVVEDAAQSFGALYHGRQTGSIGTLGCYSFYPTKNLGGAGDGGMITTSSAALADKLKLLRNHGSPGKYRHEIVGINSRLDEIQAAVVLAKLKHLDRWNALRGRLAERYEKGLGDLPLELPLAPKGLKPTWHLYSILTDRRDALAKFLESRGIGVGIYYPLPLHLQPCYRNLGYGAGSFPASESAARRILSLPMYAEMTGGQADHVISSVREFFKK